MFIHRSCNIKTILFLTKLIDIIVKPLEWYYSNRRMVKIINQHEKEWDNYKTKVRT